jgi:hypothetical protein
MRELAGTWRSMIPGYGLKYGDHVGKPLHGIQLDFVIYHVVTSSAIVYGVYKGISALM